MLKEIKFEDSIYYVDTEGKVFNEKMHELKPETDVVGYKSVVIKGHRKLIHRLVAKAFLPDFTEDKQVHHINENKSDNRLENLKAMTLLEHQRLHNQKYPETKICEVCGHVFTPDKTKRKRAHVCSLECKLKLDKAHALKRQKPINQYSINGEFIKTWDSARSIQNATGYFESNINRCCNGKIKSYKGFVWSYAA